MLLLSGTPVSIRIRRKNLPWTRSDTLNKGQAQVKSQTVGGGTRIPTKKDLPIIENKTLPLTAAFSSFTIPQRDNGGGNSDRPTFIMATNSTPPVTPPRLQRASPRSPTQPILPQATAIFDCSDDAPVAAFSRFKQILAITRDAGVDLSQGVNFHAFASLPLDVQEDQIMKLFSYLPMGYQTVFLEPREHPHVQPPPPSLFVQWSSYYTNHFRTR
jgi:hypothetical protein